MKINNEIATNHKGLEFLNKTNIRLKINNYLKSNLNKVHDLQKDNIFLEINNNIIRIYPKDLSWILSTFSKNLNYFINNYRDNEIVFDGINFHSNLPLHNNLIKNYYDHDIYIGFYTNNPNDAYTYSTNNTALSFIFQLVENSFTILDLWNEIKNADINTEFGFNSQVWFKISNNKHLEILSNYNKVIYKIHMDAFYSLVKKHFEHISKECKADIRCSKISIIIKGKESNIEFID